MLQRLKLDTKKNSVVSTLGYVGKLTTTMNSHGSRAYSEPGIVLSDILFISSNLHNKPMWVLVISFPFYSWGNGGTGWLSNFPGLHSWKRWSWKRWSQIAIWLLSLCSHLLCLLALVEARRHADLSEDGGLKLSSWKLQKFMGLV